MYLFKMKAVNSLIALLLSALTFWFYGTALAILLCLPYFILIENKRWLYILYKTIPRDFKLITRFLRMNWNVQRWLSKSYTISQSFSDVVKKQPNKIAFKSDDKQITFKQANLFSNRIGNHFKSLGYEHGDSIALFMENKIEYPCIWLGLSKFGAITALINTNLRKEALIHCIQVANTKAIIYGSELKHAIDEIKMQLGDNMKYFEYNEDFCCFNDSAKIWCNQTQSHLLNYSLMQSSDKELVDDMNKLKSSDKLVYIYTSGTTGLPKAAIMTNLRFYLITAAVYYVLNLKSNDIMYNTLPLYHTAGGIGCIGLSFIHGMTVVIRKKFSASNFWKDCIKHNCTVFFYIGEICRFLLNTPESKEDKQHKIRVMVGIGLRTEIWRQFVERFRVKQVVEVYGATEGNANMINIDSKIGAVGFVPPYLKMFYPLRLVKCDLVTGEIVRNEYGRCIKCKTNETGVLISYINETKPISQFSGYVDRKETENKVLRNVFTQGDLYFNTGDVMVQDEFGYFYFKDRTGDTFRWRGENVATSEIETTICNIIGPQETAVYGVEIPNIEGKAGMVTILDPDNKVDLQVLLNGFKEKLPSYAIPLFVRLATDIPRTGTFKIKRRDLQMEGYNLDKINKDSVYFLQNNKYVVLTNEIYNNLRNGKIKL